MSNTVTKTGTAPPAVVISPPKDGQEQSKSSHEEVSPSFSGDGSGQKESVEPTATIRPALRGRQR